jgi:hypothetical protein
MIRALTRNRRAGLLILGLACLMLSPPRGAADTVGVSCSSPAVTAPNGGGTVTANVDCLINAPDANSSYRIRDSEDNFVAPATVILLGGGGVNFLLATRRSTVVSPDGTVSSIAGTSSGFTARVSSSSLPKTIRFQYGISTTAATPPGTYTSTLSSVYYQYRICTNPSCSGQVFTGIAPVSLSVIVPAAPVAVSCDSPAVNATPGGGPFSLNVICTISGGNPSKLFPSLQNAFSPGTTTLSQGTAGLTATLQPTVTSPDGSVTGISGTAGGGFTGNIVSQPAKIQVQYTGTTTVATPPGTYIGNTPVTLTWSTL